MKQHITVEQLNELSEKGKKKLLEWYGDRKKYETYSEWTGNFRVSVNNSPPIEIVDQAEMEKRGVSNIAKMLITGNSWIDFNGKSYQRHNIHYPLFSIGQMIEFLEEHSEDKHFIGQRWHEYVIKEVQDNGDILIPYSVDELCDALWEAVKEVLEK